MRPVGLYLLLILIALVIFPVSGVCGEIKKPKVYKAWVKTLNGQKLKGFLLAVDSTSIMLANQPYNRDNNITKIDVSSIETLKIRRKGRVLKGTGLGVLSGAVVGFITGYASGDDPPCVSTGLFDCLFYVQSTAEEKGTAGAVLLSIPGGIIGAIVGSSREKFKIDGDESNYLSKMESLRPYTLTYQLEKAQESL